MAQKYDKIYPIRIATDDSSTITRTYTPTNIVLRSNQTFSNPNYRGGKLSYIYSNPTTQMLKENYIDTSNNQ